MTISWDDLSAWNLQHLELEPRTKILSPETIRKRWATIKFVGSFYNLLLYLLQWWKWIGSSGIWNGFPCFSAFQICHGFIHIKSRHGWGSTARALLHCGVSRCADGAHGTAFLRRHRGVVAVQGDLRLREGASSGTCVSHIYIYMCVCVYIYRNINIL